MGGLLLSLDVKWTMDGWNLDLLWYGAPRVLKNRAISPAVTSSDFHTEAFVVCAIRTKVTYSDFHTEVFVACAIRTELVPPSKVKTLYLLVRTHKIILHTHNRTVVSSTLNNLQDRYTKSSEKTSRMFFNHGIEEIRPYIYNNSIYKNLRLVMTQTSIHSHYLGYLVLNYSASGHY